MGHEDGTNDPFRPHCFFPILVSAARAASSGIIRKSFIDGDSGLTTASFCGLTDLMVSASTVALNTNVRSQNSFFMNRPR